MEQAAQYLAVSSTMLEEWVSKGEVPFVGLPGGEKRFSVRQLEDWIAKRLVNANVGEED